jgi:hypothetical protein
MNSRTLRHCGPNREQNTATIEFRLYRLRCSSGCGSDLPLPQLLVTAIDYHLRTLTGTKVRSNCGVAPARSYNVPRSRLTGPQRLRDP